jgi:trans-2-enoyl-CoA reductase
MIVGRGGTTTVFDLPAEGIAGDVKGIGRRSRCGRTVKRQEQASRRERVDMAITTNTRVVVLGGTSGIGLATAKSAAAHP